MITIKQWMAGVLLLASSQALSANLTPWQTITQPVTGAPQSIGGFSNGCIVGAQALPLEAPNYQVMRQEKLRYFGHPDLLDFIQRLGNQVERQRLGTMLVGDMGMPAGGRFSSGHASHQTGLDVDIWLQLPKQRWSRQQLSDPQPIDLVNADGKSVSSSLWKWEIGEMLKMAAKDGEVTRIFVHPAIKKRLCEDAGADRAWLRKIRPWFGHRAHMHVRISCPAGSFECQDQPLPPGGDGCGAELESWFAPTKPASGSGGKKKPPVLPASCQALLDNHFVTR